MSVDRRITKSKKAMKEALLTLMKTKDFRKITITDIVKASDLNRGTFYKHYQSKEELLDDLINEVLNDLIHSYEQPFENTERFFVKHLTPSAIKIFEHVKRYASFYEIIINSNVLPGFEKKLCDIFKMLAMKDVAATVQRKENIAPFILTSFTAYGLYGIIVDWVQSGFAQSPQYMAEQLVKLLAVDFNNTIIDTTKRKDESHIIH